MGCVKLKKESFLLVKKKKRITLFSVRKLELILNLTHFTVRRVQQPCAAAPAGSSGLDAVELLSFAPTAAAVLGAVEPSPGPCGFPCASSVSL